MSPKARSPVAFGAYVITRRIARGGMAEIYRARTRGAEAEWVALKLMRSSLGHEELRLRLFEREARIASKLNHENVVPVYEFGQEMGRPYLAMEYVLGRDLSHLLKNEKKGREVVDYRLGLHVGLLAARGLGHAHRLVDEATGQPLGIVHRDISPGNVMVGYGGAVKVLDFGVARMNETQGFHTQTGTLRGKFAYMSPEQTLGEDLDARSDVFSFGTVLYELLTGINCFRAQNPIATLERVQGLRPVPPSRVNRGIPKAVDKILARCLAKDKRRRFKDGAALADAIADFLEGERFEGTPALVAHMEKEFSWEKHEETSELQREEEEVAIFDVVDFAALSNTTALDAKNLAVSTEEEASQSEVKNVARHAGAAGTGVFEGEEVVSGEAEAPVADELHEEEDATIAQPLPFEDHAHEAGAEVEVASLLAPEAPADPGAPRAPSTAGTLGEAHPAAGLASPAGQAELTPEGGAAQTSVTSVERPEPGAKRRGGLAWVVAGFVIVLAGVGAFVLSASEAPPREVELVRPTKLEPVRIRLSPPPTDDKTPVAVRTPPPRLVPGPAREAPAEDEAPPTDAAVEDAPAGEPVAEAGARAAAATVKAEEAPAKRKVEPRRARPRAKSRARRRRPKKALVGYLNVGAKPWAEIQIDGKRWPYQTPQAGIELRAGKHQITLHNPDTGVTRSTAVYIKPGAYRTVMMDMRKNR